MIEIFFLSVGTVEEVHDHLLAAETGTIMYICIYYKETWELCDRSKVLINILVHWLKVEEVQN